MSGVFGVCSRSERIEQGDLLSRMAAAMTHRAWYQVDTYAAAHVALGRVGIGIFNADRQPALDQAADTAVFFAGEWYDTEPLRRELEAAGVALRTDTFEELALRLYQVHGTAFVRRVHGPFVVCIWDGAAKILHILNDRFGHYPVFYAHHDGRLVFAPEQKALACDQRFSRRTDLAAVAQMLRFQRLLGERTYYEDAKILRPASVLRYDARADALSVEAYWDFDQVQPPPPSLTFDDAVDEAGRLLRRSVARTMARPLRSGVYLSGGMDSRSLLGMATAGGSRVVTITFGQHQSADVIYAGQLAARAGSDHRYFPFVDGGWVEANAPMHLALTEGLHNWVNMHGITTLPAARELIDCNLSGWGGDEYFAARAYSLSPKLASPQDDVSWATMLADDFTRLFSWPGFTESEARGLFLPAYAHLNDLAFETFREEAARFRRYPSTMRLGVFASWNHSMRLTHNYASIWGSHVEMRYPFTDYHLVEFLTGLPLEMRLDARLHRAVLSRMRPDLALIPDASTGVPVDNERWLPTVYRAARKARRVVAQCLGRGRADMPVLYADYEAWLRTDLRAWAERLLFGERTRARGMFDTAMVQSLWARHLAGRQLHTIGRIAPLMTVEMISRLLIDGDPAPIAADAGCLPAPDRAS